MNQHAECTHCYTRSPPIYSLIILQNIGLSRTRDNSNMQICKQTE